MPIATELVGSLPRPVKLQDAYAAYDENKIGFAELQAQQDAAAEDSVEFAHQEKRGERFAAPPALLGFAPRGQTPVSLAHGVRS